MRPFSFQFEEKYNRFFLRENNRGRLEEESAHDRKNLSLITAVIYMCERVVAGNCHAK